MELFQLLSLIFFVCIWSCMESGREKFQVPQSRQEGHSILLESGRAMASGTIIEGKTGQDVDVFLSSKETIDF